MLYIPFPFKRCTKCGNYYLPTSEFFRYRKERRTLISTCIKCERAYDKSYYQSHAEREREESRQYRAEHREAVHDYNRRYEQTHRARKNIRDRQFYARHREKLREYDKMRRTRDKDKRRKRAKIYNASHVEQSRERTRRWITANPQRHLINTNRRRARKYAQPATFTENDWNRALEYFHGACAYCGKGPSLFDMNTVLHQEHHIPVAPAYELTQDNPGYAPENIIPACQSCNFSKKNREPKEWATDRFGKRKAKIVLDRVQEYFAWVKDRH